MKTSILIPTRGPRLQILDTIYSCLNTVSNLDAVEILIALDNDDEALQNTLQKEFKNIKNVMTYLVPRFGYFKLNEYYSFLASKSHGDFLWLLTDKITILSKNWDLELTPYFKKFLIAPQVTWWIESDGTKRFRPELLCPLLSKKYYEVTENIAFCGHFDSCIARILDELCELENGRLFYSKIYRPIQNIEILQDRRTPSVEDKHLFGPSIFMDPAVINNRRVSAKKIYDFLSTHPEWML